MAEVISAPSNNKVAFSLLLLLAIVLPASRFRLTTTAAAATAPAGSSCFAFADAAGLPWRRSDKSPEKSDVVAGDSSASEEPTAVAAPPHVPYLVDLIGRRMYAYIAGKPKYRFALYMLVGPIPDEESAVALLGYACNFLYCLSILLGFLFLPRGPMLAFAMLTCLVGPAAVLVLLGAAAAAMAAFAVYPLASVLTMWTFFFATSTVAQVLGRRLGLDSDGDGDVDLLDILHYAASTTWGRKVGLPRLHKILNESAGGPFHDIRRRLDEIRDSTSEIVPLLLGEEGGDGGGASVRRIRTSRVDAPADDGSGTKKGD